MKKVSVVFISSLMILTDCTSASTNVAFTCAQEAAQYELVDIHQTP